MLNIFLMGSHDSIPSSPGTGGRLLQPCTKSGQYGKGNCRGVRLMLPAPAVNTKSGVRAVVDIDCRICCEIRMHGAVIVTPYPYVTMNTAAPDGAPPRRTSDQKFKKLPARRASERPEPGSFAYGSVLIVPELL